MLTHQITKNKSKEDILGHALAGMEFEFYSNLDENKTKDSIAKLLGRKIRLEDKAHSSFKPTEREWKLEPDMSGGAGLMELVTSPIGYKEARDVLIKMCQWISKNGYTTEKCSIHLNLSFDPKKTGINGLISKMDPLKFLLDFNEREVYKMFPYRKDIVYAKSIKWIMPKLDANYFDGQFINPHVFDFAKEKYYGVNFMKLPQGYLEFRYIGGKDYEKKTSNILYLLERFTIQLWGSANNSKYNDLNLIELKRILNKNYHLVEILGDYHKLEKHYPKLKVLVDLKDNSQVLDLYWPKIKKDVIRLISHGGLKEGFINYDSDIGRIQIKHGKLPFCFGLKYYDFVDCEISGHLTSCDFFRCQLNSTRLRHCNLYQGTNVEESKVESSYTNGTCELKNCYVANWDTVFKGRMVGGIFRSGKIAEDAEFDGTEIIQSKKIK